MQKGHYRLLPLLVLLVLTTGCGGSSSAPAVTSPPPLPPAATRSFYMGFTPWPYDDTQAAIDDTNQRIQDNGDIVAHHIMGGIPWEEALQGLPYPPDVEADLNARAQMVQPGKQVFLAIESLDPWRNGLALKWGPGRNQLLQAPWDTRSFADPEVAASYINFALDQIDRFDPIYFNYGTEISELMLNNPAAFDEYVVFAEAVYDGIKAIHPNLPLMASIAMKDPLSPEIAIIAAGFDRIRDFVDVVGASAYPYVFYGHPFAEDPANLPPEWLSQINDFARGKPVAVTETGWIAQDLNIPGFGLRIPGNAEFQRAYVTQMLRESNDLNMKFVIWFTLVDYDALLGFVQTNDLIEIWRDTGLIDENLVGRPSLAEWQDWYSRVRQ